MEWRKSYLDVLLVPASLLMSMVYYCWLRRQVKSRPQTTFIAINASARRLWVFAMLNDNERKSVLAVQTLRNSIMGTTLMATTSILLCSALGALLSSTYSVKAPLQAMDSAAGDTSQLVLALKYVILLIFFLFAFLCYSLSIRFINQVAFLMNVVTLSDEAGGISPEYVAELLEKSFLLNIVGNRIFYVALPLLLWIVGPVLVFLCSSAMLPILYNLDVYDGRARRDRKSAAAVGAADHTADTSCIIVA